MRSDNRGMEQNAYALFLHPLVKHTLIQFGIDKYSLTSVIGGIRTVFTATLVDFQRQARKCFGKAVDAEAIGRNVTYRKRTAKASVTLYYQGFSSASCRCDSRRNASRAASYNKHLCSCQYRYVLYLKIILFHFSSFFAFIGWFCRSFSQYR